MSIYLGGREFLDWKTFNLDFPEDLLFVRRIVGFDIVHGIPAIFFFSKLTIETLEKGVKYVQSTYANTRTT